jgi:hypothetical protein
MALSSPTRLLVSLLVTVSVTFAQEPVTKKSDLRLQANGPNWRIQRAAVIDPKLPRVLLMGDSILNGYPPAVTKAVNGKANVDAWVTPTSQGDKSLPKQIEQVLAQGPYQSLEASL